MTFGRSASYDTLVT